MNAALYLILMRGGAADVVPSIRLYFAGADYYMPGFVAVTQYPPGFAANQPYAPGFRPNEEDDHL